QAPGLRARAGDQLREAAVHLHPEGFDAVQKQPGVVHTPPRRQQTKTPAYESDLKSVRLIDPRQPEGRSEGNSRRRVSPESAAEAPGSPPRRASRDAAVPLHRGAEATQGCDRSRF